MPWYYAGPDAKPVGPVTLEELHTRRSTGAIAPDTYVIEHTGQPNEQRAWRRYQEAFPANPVLPPVPAPPSFTPSAMPPPPAQTQVPVAQPHLMPAPGTPPAQPHLFPSQAGKPSAFTSPAGSDPYYHTPKSNPWCQWGFWLGLFSVPLLLACGLGLLIAPIAMVCCVAGLAQLTHRRDQAGRGLGIAGLLLSGAALLIGVAVLLWAVPKAMKEQEQTVTEQSSSDSQ